MRASPPDKSLYIRNREKLGKLLPAGSLAVFHSADRIIRSGDQHHPYRQDPDFFYLTGIRQEGSTLLVWKAEGDGTPDAALFIGQYDEATVRWEGVRLQVDEASAISGIRTVHRKEELDRFFGEKASGASSLWFDIRRPGEAPAPAFSALRFAETAGKKHPGKKICDAVPLMDQLRTVKEPEELERIRHACSITGEAFRNILPRVRNGMREYELEAEITREFISKGADGHAFSPIVASGRNACILHYTSNEGALCEGDLLLLDFGAEYGFYASDCSRTIPVNGRFSPRQKELYGAALRVMRETMRAMLPGTTINEIHNRACRLWEQEYIGLGLYTREELSAQDHKLTLINRYYGHGTSHFMGMDVHDPGDKSLALAPGMVLTCEPGIYIPEEGVGIRLETDVLITGEGPVDLLEDVPLEVPEIEDLMAGS